MTARKEMKPEDSSRSRFRNVTYINTTLSDLMILPLIKTSLLNLINGAGKFLQNLATSKLIDNMACTSGCYYRF